VDTLAFATLTLVWSISLTKEPNPTAMLVSAIVAIEDALSIRREAVFKITLSRGSIPSRTRLVADKEELSPSNDAIIPEAFITVFALTFAIVNEMGSKVADTLLPERVIEALALFAELPASRIDWRVGLIEGLGLVTKETSSTQVAEDAFAVSLEAFIVKLLAPSMAVICPPTRDTSRPVKREGVLGSAKIGYNLLAINYPIIL